MWGGGEGGFRDVDATSRPQRSQTTLSIGWGNGTGASSVPVPLGVGLEREL